MRNVYLDSNDKAHTHNLSEQSHLAYARRTLLDMNKEAEGGGVRTDNAHALSISIELSSLRVSLCVAHCTLLIACFKFVILLLSMVIKLSESHTHTQAGNIRPRN